MLELRLPLGQWVIFRARPRDTFTALDLLRALDFAAMAPKEVRWRRRRAKRQHKWHDARFEPFDYPVLPGFVFVRMDTLKQWNTVRGMPFIGRPLGLNGLPYSLPAADVEWVKQLDARYQPAGPTANPHIKIGDKARIAAGTLAGHVITVQDIHKDKAQAFVSLLGKLVPVRISLGDLERVA